MSWRRPGLGRGLPCFVVVAAVAALATLYYRAVALPDLIPVGYDVFTYFYPNQAYAADALRQGRLPLWNPFLFAGVPFLANSQTAVFYPFNLLFLITSVPRAYVYSVLLHVIIAGCCMYIFCRSTLAVDRLSALAAAFVFMFGGFTGGLFGHLNQLQVVAWAPLVLTLFERSYHQQSLKWAALAGGVVGLQALAGHTQELYLTLVVLGLLFLWLMVRSWGSRVIGRGLEVGGQSPSPQPPAAGPCPTTSGAMGLVAQRPSLVAILLVRRVGLLIVVVVVGFGLAAAQLVPTAELSGLSIRSGGLSFKEAASFSLPPWLLLKGLLPVYDQAPVFSEWLGYVGVTGLLLSALAVARRPRHPYVAFLAALAVLSAILAMGAATPLFALVYKLVPGANLFRVPARWLFPYTLSMASLVAVGLNSLHITDSPISRWERSGLWMALPLLLAAMALPFIVYAALGVQPSLELPGTVSLAGWCVAGLLTLGFILLGARSNACRLAAIGIIAVLLAELFAAGSGLELNRPNLPDAFNSLRQSTTHFWADKDLYRILAIADNTYDPGDLAEMKSMVGQVLSSEQVYDYVVAAKLKETMVPNLPLLYRIPTLDGYDGGALPLKRYVEFKNLFPLVRGTDSAERLREQLDAVPPSSLLSWLNVKYFLMDRVDDIWVDGVYYDLGITKQLKAGEGLSLNRVKPFATTSLGVISYLSDATSVPQGAEVATIEVVDASGAATEAKLRAGIDTAEGSYALAMARQPLAHQQPRAIGHPKSDEQGSLYLGKITLSGLFFPREITIRPASGFGHLQLCSLTLIDDRLGLSQTVPIDNSLQIAHLGDVKIYQNLDVMPRAFLVNRARLASDDEEGLSLLRSGAVDTKTEAVALADEWRTIYGDRADDLLSPGRSPEEAGGASPLSHNSAGMESGARIISYEPERVRIETSAQHRSLLVLTDSYYPGWHATVDGQEQPIVRVNHLFRGVLLEPGQHHVEFTFEPLSVKLGLAISGATLLLVVAAIAWAWRRGNHQLTPLEHK